MCPDMKRTIENLDFTNKESLVSFLFLVQTGHVSCRKAATILIEKHIETVHELQETV